MTNGYSWGVGIIFPFGLYIYLKYIFSDWHLLRINKETENILFSVFVLKVKSKQQILLI